MGGEEYWSCTSGAAATPTCKRNIYGTVKRTCFWQRIYVLVLYTVLWKLSVPFRTVQSREQDSIQDGRLGINASHGCVRLSLANAKWIYDNIPRGTKSCYLLRYLITLYNKILPLMLIFVIRCSNIKNSIRGNIKLWGVKFV